MDFATSSLRNVTSRILEPIYLRLSSIDALQSRASDLGAGIYAHMPPLLDLPAGLLAKLLAYLKAPPGTDLSDPLLAKALIVIALAPLIWNTIARFEYRTKTISNMVGRYVGCYLLALWIFFFSLHRDKIFFDVIAAQGTSNLLDNDELQVLAGVLLLVGIVLVSAAYVRLGIAGTYLGDHFGILFDAKITGFPFNVTDHPMYEGATLLFFAKAILSKSMVGVLMSCWIYVVYRLASQAEGDFTDLIYTEAKSSAGKSAATASSTAKSTASNTVHSNPKKNTPKKPKAAAAKTTSASTATTVKTAGSSPYNTRGAAKRTSTESSNISSRGK